MPLNRFYQNFVQIRLIHIRSGNIDGNRYRVIAQLIPFLQYGAGAVPDKLIQFSDEAIFLK